MIFFFFKQKTAYEMRISDWSSDVCSSDLSPELKVSSFGQSPEDPEVSSVQPALDAQASSTIRQAVGNVEDAMIRETLERNKGNKKRAAEELGISRSYLYKKLGEMGQR